MLEVCFSTHPNIYYRTFFACKEDEELLYGCRRMDIKTFNLQYNKKLNIINTYLDDKFTILYRCSILYSNTLR